VRVLLVHNSYRQRGGEDAVFEAERDLLAAAGHEVLEYRVHNDAVDGLSPLRLAARTVWSGDARRELAVLCRRARPDVAHFHNTLPLISPAAYGGVRSTGVPVVQTLHNYRMVCPSALLYRDGRPCEDCVGLTLPWPAVRHGCYRGSRAASAAVGAMLAAHRALGTYRRNVDAWIALTGFQAELVSRGGVPRPRIAVLPNFLAEDPGVTGPAAPRGGVLFVGRLTEEKGVGVLLAALRELPRTVRLRVVGDGPLRPAVEAAARADARVEMLGACAPAEVDAQMRRAAVLAVPSLWYEGLPMTVVEAYARGLPVVASDLGGLAAIVEDGLQGVRVPAGDAGALARALGGLCAAPARLCAMGEAARATFERRYTAARHLDGLLGIYEAVGRCARDGSAPILPDAAAPAVGSGIQSGGLAVETAPLANMPECPPSDRSIAVLPPGS
jgi:glycosyltransferase involved in cell wall biosynthesis